jgi:putative nucleotidyltransferase with HDIG domain
LPPFPAIASRLLRIVAQEDFSYREVANLVRSDPAFSAEVLRLANSPLLHLRYEIRDIPHAVSVMGVHRLRGIVMTLAMKDFLLKARSSEALTRSWRHSLATALVTELLADATFLDKGLGYTAGLLHDIGTLAFLNIDDGAYATLIHEGHDEDELMGREIECFGINHCEAGKWLLRDWGLPTEFQEVAARHHEVPERGCLDITALVQIGAITADHAGFPVIGQMPERDPRWTLSWFEGPVCDRVQDRIEDLPLAIATKINSFDCDFLT